MARKAIRWALLLTLCAGSLSWAGQKRWQVVGAADAVDLASDGRSVRMQAADAVTAGILSRPISVRSGATAILVAADVSGADAQSVTFAVHDARNGDACGYWKDPLPAMNPTPLAAVLTLHDDARTVRLFVGTHDCPSTAQITNIRWRFLRQGPANYGSVYGAAISGKFTKRQTFTATGSAVGAAVIRITQRQASQTGPNLRARLYEWKDNMPASIQTAPLTETTVVRTQIPGYMEGGSDDNELAATYLGGARDLTIPLSARTVPGRKYVLELGVDGPCEPSEGFLMYAWLDGYPGGQLYDNVSTRGRNWDLRMEIYNAAW